jgi:hypothetical protein
MLTAATNSPDYLSSGQIIIPIEVITDYFGRTVLKALNADGKIMFLYMHKYKKESYMAPVDSTSFL